MISKYTYIKGNVTTITPEPKFYDSFYFAGDDIVYALIKNAMLLDEDSAFRKELKDLSFAEYRQNIKNFLVRTTMDRQLLIGYFARISIFSIPFR